MKYVLLFQIDTVLLLSSCYWAYGLKFDKPPVLGYAFIQESIAITVLCQLLLFVNELYEVNSKLKLWDIATRTVLSFIISALVLVGIYLAFPGLLFGNWLFFYAMALALILVIAWRIAFIWLQPWLGRPCRVIIYGSGSTARMIAQEIVHQGSFDYELAGFADDHPEHIGRKVMGFKVLSARDELEKLIAEGKADKIVVALSQRRGVFPVNALLDYKLKGAQVIDLPDFYERLTGKILIKDLRPSWLIFASGFRQTPAYRRLKRAIDVVIAVAVLIITSPILLVTAILIKAESSGPVFFKQERSGEFGKVFTLFKFRSMRADAEELTGPVWAQTNDSRITRVGNIIRKLRIDELPQLINVLRGEMSFVGPRPERPFFIKKLQERVPYYTQRLTVKPGITGWAAVKYQYSSSVEGAVEKLQYDLFYIKNISLWLDILIMLKTIQVILTGRGSR